MRRAPWLVALALLALPLHAEPLRIASGEARVSLLELYTSEGCSSCPPADRWFLQLADDPELWRTRVPVAFHVDYWDRLGWPDRFAHPDHAGRQRAYAAAGRVGTVYTPGFVVDGREWRGWFGGRELPPAEAGAAGVLELEVDGARLAASYTPAAPAPSRLDLHVVLLGFDLESAVAAGENAGRTLRHAFVVLDHRREPLRSEEGAHRARFDWPRDGSAAPRLALAAWVTPRDGLEPLQAAGGWLP